MISKLLYAISLQFGDYQFKFLSKLEKKGSFMPTPQTFSAYAALWVSSQLSTYHTAFQMIVYMCGSLQFSSFSNLPQLCYVFKWIKDFIDSNPELKAKWGIVEKPLMAGSCHHFGVPYLLTRGQHLVATQYVFAEWINDVLCYCTVAKSLEGFSDIFKNASSTDHLEPKFAALRQIKKLVFLILLLT